MCRREQVQQNYLTSQKIQQIHVDGKLELILSAHNIQTNKNNYY